MHKLRFGTLLLEKSTISSEVGDSNRCSLPKVQFIRQRKDSISCSNCVICISSRDCTNGKNPVTFLERRERKQRN